MIMKLVLLTLLLLLLITIPGFQSLSAAQDYPGKPVPITPLAPDRPWPRTSFATGGGIWDQTRLVIRDPDAWLLLWKRLHTRGPVDGPSPEPSPLPEIDFSREMVVVASMGQRGSSSFEEIVIESASERGIHIEVVVRSAKNRKGCGAYTMMTAPVDIVRLPKSERGVVFREIEVVPDCIGTAL